MVRKASIAARVIAAYARQETIDIAEARSHFQHLERFLAACSANEERCAPSEAVDGLWHHFIQYTREYREYCVGNFGKLIDHDPSPKSENIEAYIRTRAYLEGQHGRLDIRWWPTGKAATICGATICGATICGAQVAAA